MWLDRMAMAILIGLSAWLSLTLARGPGELSADATLYAAKKAGRNTCRMQCVDNGEIGGGKTDAQRGR